MAEILETNQMLADTFEPKRKFRWILAIDGIDAFTAKTANRPQMVFDETIVDYMNQKRYLAGKMTPSPLNITLYDPISPSASQKVQEWIRLCYEVVSGRAGYAQFYKKQINLKMADPVGGIVEDWSIYGTWIQDVNYGDLDYSVSDPAEIALVLRFDYAVLNY